MTAITALGNGSAAPQTALRRMRTYTPDAQARLASSVWSSAKVDLPTESKPTEDEIMVVDNYAEEDTGYDAQTMSGWFQ